MSFFSKIASGISNFVSHVPGPIGWAGSAAQSFFDQETAEDQMQDEMNFNSYEAKKNRDFQREERELTQQYNERMWEKNNKYNSPDSQIARATSAGINPNSVVESLSRNTSNPVTSSPMSGSAASAPGSLASSMLLHSAQVANLAAQTRKADSEANLNEQEYAYNNVTFSDRVNALKYANKETLARLGKILSDKDIQEKTYELFARKNEEELNHLRELINKTKVEIDNLKKQGNLLDAQTQGQKINNDNLKKQGNLLDAQTQGQKINNNLASLQYQFSKESGIPQGTDVGEAIWKTVVNGQGTELIDIFMENVEEAMKHSLRTGVNIAFGGPKRMYERLKERLSNKFPFFGSTTPPNSVRNPR